MCLSTPWLLKTHYHYWGPPNLTEYTPMAHMALKSQVIIKSKTLYDDLGLLLPSKIWHFVQNMPLFFNTPNMCSMILRSYTWILLNVSSCPKLIMSAPLNCSMVPCVPVRHHVTNLQLVSGVSQVVAPNINSRHYIAIQSNTHMFIVYLISNCCFMWRGMWEPWTCLAV